MGPLYLEERLPLPGSRHAVSTFSCVRPPRRNQTVIAASKRTFHNGRGISQNGSGNLLDNLPGLGLLNMRERVTNLGGQFKIDSKEDEGVIIIIELNKENQ